MRDNHLGGLNQLKPVFEHLYKTDSFAHTLREKQQSVQLWNEVATLFAEIELSDHELKSFIASSIEYGKRLFTLVAAGWEVMALGYMTRMESSLDNNQLLAALQAYDKAYETYQAMSDHPQSSTLYKNDYWSMPEHPKNPGLAASVEDIRQTLTLVC